VDTPNTTLDTTALVLLHGEGPSHDAKRRFLLAFYDLAATCPEIWNLSGGNAFGNHPAFMVYGPATLLAGIRALPGVCAVVCVTDATSLEALLLAHPETFKPPAECDLNMQ
jgi:hypothetical protein